MGETPSPRPGR